MKTCPRCEKEFDDGSLEFCPDDGGRLVNIPSGEAPPDPLVGQMLTERIRIESKIGEGGMGAVYKGEDVLLGRTVAVKIMHLTLKHSPDEIRRFLHEARVVARLRHPNTIQVFDFGEARTGHYYIAMEYMTGEPLDLYFERSRPTIGRIFEIVEQVCLSLEEAHAAGIVHRDLKPDNIFIDTVNNRRIVKVIDFGIAKLVEGGENLTQQGMVFGTPAYMSPEQARGEKLDARSDVYALGCVMFAMLTGRPPFVGESAMDVAIQHLTQPPPDLQSLSRFGALPARLVDLVNQTLSKDRTKRPQSVSEVRQRVLEIARSTPEVRFDAPGSSGAMLKIRTEPTFAQPSAGITQTAGRTTTGKATAPIDTDSTSLEVQRPPRTKLVAITLVVLMAAAAAAVFATRSRTPATGEPPVVDAADVVDTSSVAAVVVDAGAPAIDWDAVVAAAKGHVPSACGRAIVAAQQATASVSVTSTPPGATVTDAATGAVLGVTPLTWTTRARTEAATLHFELDGYVGIDAWVNPANGATAEATLARTPSGRRERPQEAEPTTTTTTEETPPTENNGGGLELRRPVTIPNK